MSGTREFTGRHMALLICGFFGVVIAVNLVLAVSAGRTWTGLIVKNGYVASQEYNGVLARARAQEALGWTGTVRREGDRLLFELRDGEGAAVPGLEVLARLARTTHEHDDADLVFSQTPSGVYAAEQVLAGGKWSLDLTAADGGGRTWRKIFQVYVDPDKS